MDSLPTDLMQGYSHISGPYTSCNLVTSMEESPFKSFSTLPQEDRRKFLTEFASHFRPSDWWHLDRLLQQQTIYRRFDIVPALPIELAVQVLQYLQLPELFLNRRVSRRWRNLLSSDAICRSLALVRFPAASREFILSQQSENHSNIKSWRHLLEDIASRRYFFSKGKYIAYPQLDSLITELFEFATVPPCLNLYEKNFTSWDHRLTFMKHQNVPEVVVWNLHDPAQMMRFPIPNREMISAYATHSELLTVLTSIGRCHAFRLDTGERKTISLESAAYRALIVMTSTVAIIYSTNIIVWETNTDKSWKVETSLVEPRVWAYDLDPVGRVISRIYPDKVACVVLQEQFSYGVNAEECYPRSSVLKRVAEHSYTPVKTANDIYRYSGYRIDLNGILVFQNFRKIWGDNFMCLLLDEIKGMIMPSLAYDYSRGEWKVREITVPKAFDRRHGCESRSTAHVLEDATAFWSDTSVDIYLSDEDRWIKWAGEEWQGISLIPVSMPYILLGGMSSRHVIMLVREGEDERVEVRRFMGIHERETLEERYRGKVEDAYGTLLKGSGVESRSLPLVHSRR
ncbi:hypothetical protein EV426DRAFT_367537 [Tirmania nivea]|nr:hypothetical protein EV426DRAFT_367537 [Tirmania nivea]